MSKLLRSYLAVIAAILIAGVLMSTSLSVVVGAAETATSVSTSATGTSHLYELEFVQESNCPYGSWLIPWAVVVDNETLVQPSNATVPTPSSYTDSRLTSNSSYSAIWFSVPDGTYNYTILPDNFYGAVETGTATIDGSNVEVMVYAFITAMGCSSSTTTVTTTSATVTPTLTSTQTIVVTTTITATSYATLTPNSTVTSSAFITVSAPGATTTVFATVTVTLPITTTATTTVLGPTATTTHTSPSVPVWAYAVMVILLFAGLAIGYVMKKPPVNEPQENHLRFGQNY